MLSYDRQRSQSQGDAAYCLLFASECVNEHSLPPLHSAERPLVPEGGRLASPSALHWPRSTPTTPPFQHTTMRWEFLNFGEAPPPALAAEWNYVRAAHETLQKRAMARRIESRSSTVPWHC